MQIDSDYGKNMQSEASAQTDLETESEMQNDLKVCKAQLESRDCRIQELRQALNKSCARHGMLCSVVVQSFRSTQMALPDHNMMICLA